MADYKEMYEKLFRAQVKAIHILQEVQQITEDMFVEAKEPIINLIVTSEDVEESTIHDSE